MFDKTRVFSGDDCTQVKVGSIGYFGDSYHRLYQQVKDNVDPSLLTEVVLNWDVCSIPPFQEDGEVHYDLFYLVEAPEEKKMRPMTIDEILEWLKTTDNNMVEMLEIDDVPTHRFGNVGISFEETTVKHYRFEVGYGVYSYEDFIEQARKMDGSKFEVEDC